MAAPSAQTLQRLADETGHQPGTLEKVLRLLNVVFLSFIVFVLVIDVLR